MTVAAAVRVHAALWMRVIVGQRAAWRLRAPPGGRAGVDGGGGNNIYWRQMDTGRTPDGGAEGRGEPDGRRAVLPTDAIMKTYFCRCRLLPRPVALERREAHCTVLCTLVIFSCARRCF